MSGLSVGGGILQSILNIYPPLAHRYQKMTNMSRPELIPALGDLVQMTYRDQVDKQSFYRFAAENGYADIWADAFYNASEQLLQAYDYVTLFRRGVINEEQRDRHLHHLQFSDLGIAHLLKATEYFPSPPDLIRFAVREVYTPDLAEKFGLFQDIPEDFLKEAEKAGLPEEMATLYWGSHWELPSAMQGFQMLHRHIIDQDTLKQLLRALDVMPYWRDQLVQLSYNPITRVDVRRMYRLGVITDDAALQERYEAIGYKPEDAALLVEFTKKYEGDEYAGISRANLVKAYTIGVIDKEQLRDLLGQLGYSDTVVDFWVNMAEYELALQLIENDTTDLVQQYLRGQKTIDQIRDELNRKDLPASYVNATVSAALSQESKKTRLPTKTDLMDWFEQQIIDEKTYHDYMSQIGYRDQDIANYLTEQSLERDTTKRKYLHINTYLRWWLHEMISEEQLREYAEAKGIAQEDLEILMMETQQ